MFTHDIDRQETGRSKTLPGGAWSVVVCAYTEERWDRLIAALDSLDAQIVAPAEVVLVVDHNDMLLRRARAALADGAVEIHANTGDRGLSGARNTGVAVATGDVIAFLDDDAEAEPNWLEELAVPFADPRVAGAGGTAAPSWSGAGAPSWFPEEFHWVVGCSYKGLPERPAEIRNPIGASMAFRRAAIDVAGGFSGDLGRVGDDLTGGEETDLAIRVRRATGGTVMLAPGAVVNHHVPASRRHFSYFLRRCYGEGRSKAVLALRVGGGDATSSERAYLRTLAHGLADRIGGAIRQRAVGPLLQAGAMTIGLVVTGTGFAVGLVATGLGTRGRRA